MLEGKPLNNFVTLQGTVRIIIDGKLYSTHKGNLMEWRHKDRLKVRNASNTFEIKNSTEPESVQHKEVILSLKARDEGNVCSCHCFYTLPNLLSISLTYPVCGTEGKEWKV